MKPHPHEFLAELYAIDPGLKQHEAELLPLLKRLLASDPAQTPDPAFVARLRRQLQERAAEEPAPASRFSFLPYLLGGAVTAAVILPVAYLGFQNLPKNSSEAPAFAYRIENVNDEAFGPLTNVTAAPMGGRGGGGGGGPAMGGDAIATTEQSNPVQADKMMVPYPMVQYEYVFEGDLPELSETVSVYQRKQSSRTLPLSAIGSLNLGTVNPASFDGMRIDSLTLAQNTPFGLQMFVNLRDSSINIDAQWEHWPMSKCTTEACYRAEQVKLGDIPADEELIRIAKAFAADHGIDLSHYGEPQIDNIWRADYERATDKSMAYVPEVQRVVFPLLIDGKPTYDQSGMPTGLSIGIHAKHKRVMNVYGLMDRTYQKSDYAGVTDEAAIRKYLTTFENYYGGPAVDIMRAEDQPQTQKSRVILGTPTLSYAMFYRYSENRNDELVVPSLIFPIEKIEGERGFFYRSSVVVPLSQEMLKQNANPGDIRPMMETK